MAQAASSRAGLVLVGQAEHALGGAQPVQRVVCRAARRSPRRQAGPISRGLPAAPCRGAHVERDLLRRVVGRGRSACPAACADVGLDQLAAGRRSAPSWRWTGRRGSCPISRHGTEYRLLPTLTWMSGPTLHRDHSPARTGRAAAAPARRPRRRRTPPPGAAPSSGRHARCPATSRAPAHRLGLHLRQAGELPAPPERVPDIRHRPLDLRPCPSACAPAPGRPGSRNARPARHRTG